MNPLVHPMIRKLDRIVQRLNLAIGQAQLDKAPIRPAFLKGWQSYIAGWRENANQVASSIPVDKLQVRLEKWIDAFVAEGIIPDPCGARVAAGGDTDPLVWTPSSISAEVAKVKTEFDVFNRNLTQDPDAKVLDRAKEPNASVRRVTVAELAAAWSPVFDEFNAWVKSGPSTVWGATAAMAKDYEARGRNFEARYSKVGGSTTGFGVNDPSLQERPGAPMPPWEKGVIAGLALLLGIIVLPKILPAKHGT